MFDLKLQAFDFQVVTDEELKQLEVASTVGFLFPAGPNQMVPIAIGVIRLPIDRDAALAYAEELREAAEALPKRSNIEVATSLRGVDEAVAVERNLRG